MDNTLTGPAYPLRTITGKVVDLKDFRPEDVNMYDIAWALHQTSRYNGHTPVPWSVLSHTGLAYLLAIQRNKGPLDPRLAISILLHDAAEAYIGDIVRPLKALLGRSVYDIEGQILDCIFRCFGLDIHDQDWDTVKVFDNQALYVEYYRLYPNVRNTEDMPEAVYPLEKVPALMVGNPAQYIEAVRGFAVTLQAPAISNLFQVPEEVSTLFQQSPPQRDTTQDAGGFSKPDNSDVESMRV